MKNKTRDLTSIALFIALLVVFDVLSKFIPFLQMPNGGSVDLGVIVLLMASFALGWKKGMIVALLGMIVTFMFSPPYILSIPQFIFDYVIPVMVIPFAAVIKNRKSAMVMISIFAVFVLRIVSLVASGALFWPPEGSVAGGQEAWIFSLAYNLPYSIMTFVVVTGTILILWNRIEKINKVY